MRISYDEARRRGLLESIATGRYWRVAEDFSNGQTVDPPELQKAKAIACLQELKAQIAQLPDPKTCPAGRGEGSRLNIEIQIAILTIHAEVSFNESTIKVAIEPPPQGTTDAVNVDEAPAPTETDSTEAKLKAAREFAKKLW